MKTKGALLWELNSSFKVDEIDLGDPVADEVQIRVHAAGMCHSDYHLTTGATPIGLPALGGHEGAGVVTKVGKNVTGIEEGDHIILAFIPACGECQPCLKGYRSLCDRGAVLLGGKAIADGTSRVHAGSTEVSPMNLLGTFAPYMTVHKDSVVKIDKDIPFKTAANPDHPNRHLRGDGHGFDDGRRRQAQPLPVHHVAEDLEGQHLRRRQLTRRDAEACRPLQVRPAEDRRDGHHDVFVGEHQRRLPGHAGRQEHPRRHQVHRI
jgi:Alcohol dehydrogenase GroES-like domain